jgi:hypothetical protein
VLGITVSPWPLACPVDAVLTQSIRDDETPAHVQPFLSVAMPFWTGETVEIAVPRPGSWQLKLVAHPGVPDREGSLDVDVTSPYVTLKPDECAATFGVRLTSAQVAAIDAFARR